MKLSSKVTQLTDIIEPAVAACNVALWGIEFAPQGHRSLLRIYIEALPEAKAKGMQVTIEDCAAVNHQVSGILEVYDPISGEFILEVSSPGLDRTFFNAQQMYDYINQIIKVRLIHAVGIAPNKRRKITGELLQVNDTTLTIKTTDDHELQVMLDNIDKANLIYQQ